MERCWVDHASLVNWLPLPSVGLQVQLLSKADSVFPLMHHVRAVPPLNLHKPLKKKKKKAMQFPNSCYEQVFVMYLVISPLAMCFQTSQTKKKCDMWLLATLP